MRKSQTSNEFNCCTLRTGKSALFFNPPNRTAVTEILKPRLNFFLPILKIRRIFNHMVKRKSCCLDATFAALADPTRRRILEHLAKGKRRVTDLAAPFSISLPAVSKHLRVLESARLLTRHRQGREHRLELHPGPLKDAIRWIEQYRRFWEGSLEALADYLETTNKKGK